MKYTLGELAEHVSGKVKGDASCIIESVATLQNANASQISFLTNPSYRKQLANSHAGAVIMSATDAENCILNVIISENPYAAYAKVAALLSPGEQYTAGIDPSAHIAADAQISDSASIAPGVVIESGVSIGDKVRIGAGCVIQKNVKIGADTVLTANITVAYAC
ncbi:MAG: UDP-3-O-(3-hydroxymyristoyl)glucosamine N-acyltransferase, partial [Gammaproteobacteria bacterium]|nr:UDP-3-O-(3-hydroxymyristoyl)glucosamine N-acyltransferase [Gammaproteobacteria bacterium]